jgi:tRNA-splicing ligase RtcB
MSNPVKDGNILVWGAEGIEPETIEQARRTAALPFVSNPLALMPDAHIGIGATIGSVAFMQGAIVPSAVGVDIGCGMVASLTSLRSDQLPDDLSPLLALVEQRVPAGVGKGHNSDRQPELPPFPNEGLVASLALDPKERKTFLSQFGSLGSGNHFVEVCLDESGRVWVVLHSGSRGIGNKLAQSHINGAKRLMAKYFITLDDPDLAYFVEHTPEFDAYVADMLWAQRYAAANRDEMMGAVLASVREVTDPAMVELERVNCHHNFAAREHHHGRDGWVIRKGAIRAREGDRGVIPGSMGASTFIVTGLGNRASYDSCSHGAGRRMSRTAAKRELSEESLSRAMTGKTWQGNEAKALLDEHPSAYKDVEAVMAAQADLVRIDHRLSQVLNYKGTK